MRREMAWNEGTAIRFSSSSGEWILHTSHWSQLYAFTPWASRKCATIVDSVERVTSHCGQRKRPSPAKIWYDLTPGSVSNSCKKYRCKFTSHSQPLYILLRTSSLRYHCIPSMSSLYDSFTALERSDRLADCACPLEIERLKIGAAIIDRLFRWTSHWKWQMMIITIET